MKHSDFKLGEFFSCSDANMWLCTDIGTRTVIAIRIDTNMDKSWYNGPPYGVGEHVFDEYDFPACEKIEVSSIFLL